MIRPARVIGLLLIATFAHLAIGTNASLCALHHDADADASAPISHHVGGPSTSGDSQGEPAPPCDHEDAALSCGSMVTCGTLSVESSPRPLTIEKRVAHVASRADATPLSRWSAPETPPPRLPTSGYRRRRREITRVRHHVTVRAATVWRVPYGGPQTMIAILWLVLATAQDTARVPRLELAQVYQLARVQSPRAAAARALADAARARVAGAKLPPDPEIQLGFMNYALPALSPMEPIGMTQLQVMQMIPTAGKLRLSGRGASALASAAYERMRDVEWDVRAQAAMSFYDLFAADRALEVSRQTVRLLQDVRATAEAMYRVGEARQADVLRAQLEIARMVEDTVRMATMRSAMSARLNAHLDRPADAPVPSPALPVFPDSLLPLDAALGQAQASRPMVRAAEREVDAATAQLLRARREIWPDVTVGVQYGQRGSALGGGTERMGSLMVGASIPVFAGGRQLKMRQEAGAMREMAESELAEMRARTRAAVASAHASLVRARNLAALYRTTIIPQAEATASSALAAYRVGGVDFMTLLDDRMTVNKYRQDLFALEGEQGKAWAELEMLIGRELFDPNTVARTMAGRESR